MERSEVFLERPDSKVHRERVEAILPYINFMFLAFGIFGRAIIVVLSYWRPNLCKAFYGYQMLIICIKETAPVEFGEMWRQFLRTETFLTLVILTNEAKLDLFVTFVAHGYLHFVVHYIIYDLEWSMQECTFGFVVDTLFFMLGQGLIHLFYSWIGFTYLASELPRESNEELLNNLKEAVFILDEQSSAVLFQNMAAKRTDKRLQHQCNFSFVACDKSNEPLIDLDSAKLNQIDKNALKKLDFMQSLQLIEQVSHNP